MARLVEEGQLHVGGNGLVGAFLRTLWPHLPPQLARASLLARALARAAAAAAAPGPGVLAGRAVAVASAGLLARPLGAKATVLVLVADVVERPHDCFVVLCRQNLCVQQHDYGGQFEHGAEHQLGRPDCKPPAPSRQAARGRTRGDTHTDLCSGEGAVEEALVAEPELATGQPPAEPEYEAKGVPRRHERLELLGAARDGLGVEEGATVLEPPEVVLLHAVELLVQRPKLKRKKKWKQKSGG